MSTEGLTIFSQWCLATQQEDKLRLLFDLLLTQEEKESIASRCLIVQELIKHEKTQRDIANDLNVSIAKITRGSNELKRMPKALIAFLKDCIAQHEKP